MAKMRREGRRGSLGLGLENTRKGDGRGIDGGVKLLRSSSKNLEGGGISVSASSMSQINLSSRPGQIRLSLRTTSSSDY